MNIESQLEALLFWKGEPISKKKVLSALDIKPAELEEAIKNLETSLSNRIMITDDEIELRTAPEVGKLIEKLTKDELMRDLGKAGLETLSIILYKSPVKRSEIDYIRGVNSSFIIRNLLIRGLIDRVSEKEATGRGYSYKPTMDLLAHLGIAKIEDLPEYSKVKEELEAFAAETEKTEQESESKAPEIK
jgi:segregation and condensation protein B